MNERIDDSSPASCSACASLRKRIADLEHGLKQIAYWTEEDQADPEICALQWRGCVAIARELLKPNSAISLNGKENE